MDTETLSLFVDVFRHGSFAAVARDRNRAPSSISRAISSLEEELGVRLFQRTTRRLSPTEAGQLYFSRVEPLVEALDGAREAALDLEETPRGTVRLTAPVSFAQQNLIPHLGAFTQQYPRVRLELMLTDARVDLLAQRMDMAIRLGQLEDSSLIARRLCSMRYVVCASPTYLKRDGIPKTPQDLANHRCLTFPLPGVGPTWRFRRNEAEAARTIDVSGPLSISNALALRDAALAGIGVTLLATWVAGQALHSGELVDLFPGWEVTGTGFGSAAWLIVPSRDYVPLKVRAVQTFLSALFQGGPPAAQGL